LLISENLDALLLRRIVLSFLVFFAVLLGESGEQIRLLRQLVHLGDLAVDPAFYALLYRHNLI